MSVAALKVEELSSDTEVGNLLGITEPVRCLLMDDSRFDRRHLRSIADESRFEMTFFETTTIAETRQALNDGQYDLLLLDYRVPDGDGIELAADLIADPELSTVPIIVVTGEGSEKTVIQAMRSGVADYLSKDYLSVTAFDEAVENALQQGQRLSRSSEKMSTLEAENQSLRDHAMRNMRLLKGQALPLMSFAWRALEHPIPGIDDLESTARKLAKINRHVTGLIDDTVINAATYRETETKEVLNLNGIVANLLSDKGGELFDSRADVRCGNLPQFNAIRSHFEMLFQELLLTAVRNAPLGQVAEIRMGAGVDPEGNPILWITENGVALSARKRSLAQRHSDLEPERASGTGQDAYTWSLCQRLVEKNGGSMRISSTDEAACKIMLRFPKSILA